jgi:response regulator RpfG family c-di-GMP phosphodiesterase
VVGGVGRTTTASSVEKYILHSIASHLNELSESMRDQMTLSGRDVLLVGQSFQSAQALTDRLHQLGFRCHLAKNMQAASEILSSRSVDLVLSSMHLSDGTGFGLLSALAGLPVTMFLCLPVENSCFWLPAMDGGKECLGSPALRPSEFANALKEMGRGLASAQTAD